MRLSLIFPERRQNESIYEMNTSSPLDGVWHRQLSINPAADELLSIQFH